MGLGKPISSPQNQTLLPRRSVREPFAESTTKPSLIPTLPATRPLRRVARPARTPARTSSAAVLSRASLRNRLNSPRPRCVSARVTSPAGRTKPHLARPSSSHQHFDNASRHPPPPESGPSGEDPRDMPLSSLLRLRFIPARSPPRFAQAIASRGDHSRGGLGKPNQPRSFRLRAPIPLRLRPCGSRITRGSRKAQHQSVRASLRLGRRPRKPQTAADAQPGTNALVTIPRHERRALLARKIGPAQQSSRSALSRSVHGLN